MTVLGDSRYAGLAGTAAAALGAGSPDVARAILSQWQCELGASAPWPPPRNNPGNIARGLASGLGLPWTVAPGANPQPSNPIVTYPSAQIGATAYAQAIATQSRYRSVLAAARAGDGLAYVRAMGSSGWGTGLNCMLSVYRGTAATGSGGNNGTASGGGSGGIVVASVDSKAQHALDLLAQAGITDLSMAHVFTQAEAESICRVLYKLDPAGTLGSAIVRNWAGKTVQDWVGSSVSTGYSSPLLDLSWVPGFSVSAGVLVVSVYLVLTGIRDILGDVQPGAAIAAA